MCGISGLMKTSLNQFDLKKAKHMDRLLSHRGPDGSGIFKSDKVIMFHKRLSIIDISGGNQPIRNNELVLVANGEIYNDPELRKNEQIYNYKTKSDSESILAVYKRFGTSGFQRLRGMYAFAIYSLKEDILILGRDPFGIKPLYFCCLNNGFLFSSEIQAITKSTFAKPRIKERKRNELLEFQFCTGRETIFHSIYRLRPGEIIIVKNNKIIKSEIFNKLSHLKKFNYKKSSVSKKIRETINLHQRSDVPYGAFFSGGIDSSLILYFMSKMNSKPIKSYSISFKENKKQSEYLKKLCKKFNSELTIVDFSEKDFWDYLPKVANIMDDPIIDYASVPTYKLASIAKNEVKVVLTGEGGDELFGGYGRYRNKTKDFLSKGTFNKLNRLQKYLCGWNFSIEFVKENIKNKKLTKLQKAQFFDFEEWLPNDLLIKLDRCLMAHGIEGRTPFVDIDMFKNLFLVDDKIKINNGIGKLYIRNFLKENLSFFNSFEKKAGFTVPITLWLPKYKIFFSEILPKIKCLNTIFPEHEIKNLCLSLGKNKNSITVIWRLIFFALWHDANVGYNVANGNTFDILVTLSNMN